MTANLTNLRTYLSWILLGKTKFPAWTLLVILALIDAALIGYLFFSKVQPALTNIDSTAANLLNEVVPADLEVTIKDGVATTNVAEPYYLTVDSNSLENALKTDIDVSDNTKMRLLAIDTKANPDQFENYQSYALLTTNSLVYYDDDAIKIQSLREIDDITLNRQKIQETIDKAFTEFNLKGLIKASVFIVPIVVFLFSLIGTFFLMWLVTFLASPIPSILHLKVKMGNLFRFVIMVGFPGYLLLNILRVLPLFGQPNFELPVYLDKVVYMFTMTVVYIVGKYSTKIDLKQIAEYLVAFLTLPGRLSLEVIVQKHPDKTAGKVFWWLIAIFLFLAIPWLQAYGMAIYAARQGLYNSGVVDTLTSVTVSGTSMLPGIKDGEEISLHNPQKFGLDRGDVISFENEKTDGSHYLKRLIALPGEVFSLRNGVVFINGQGLQEPYLLNNLPTYGNSELLECVDYTVPEDAYVVLGDNRTISSDSRVLSFVKRDDIDGVIKASQPPTFYTPDQQQKIERQTVTEAELLTAMTEMRQTASASASIKNNTLAQIAAQRATFIRDNPTDWKTKIDSLSAQTDAKGYRYNSVHEYVTYGYLNAAQVIEQIKDNELEHQAFTSPQSIHLGVGVVEQQSGSCQYPVIVIVTAWPSVAEYAQSDITGWQNAITNTDSQLRILQSWVGQSRDETKLRQMINNTAEMNQIARRIHSKMVNREWLTNTDYGQIRRFESLYEQTSTLAAEVFGT